jgi:hypothetical protein
MSVFDILQTDVLKIEMPRSVMNDEQFFEFCTPNKDWQVERSKDGQILIMPQHISRITKLQGNYDEWKLS